MSKNKTKFIALLIFIYIILGISNLAYATDNLEWKNAYKEFILDYENRLIDRNLNIIQGDFKLQQTPKVSGNIWDVVEEIFGENANDDRAKYIDFEKVKLLNLIDDEVPQLVIQSEIYAWSSEGWSYYDIYTYKDGKVIKLEEDRSLLTEYDYDDYYVIYYKEFDDKLDEIILKEEELGSTEINFADVKWDGNKFILDKINNDINLDGFKAMDQEIENIRDEFLKIIYMDAENEYESVLISFPIVEKDIDKSIDDYIKRNKLKDDKNSEEEKEENKEKVENNQKDKSNNEVKENKEDEKLTEEKSDSNFIIKMFIGLSLVIVLIIGLIFYNRRKRK